MRIHLQGAKELDAALASLSIRISRKIAREALEFGAEPMRAEASRLAPRRSPTPDMADNIVISPTRTIDNEIAAIKMGPAKGFAYGLPQEIGTSRHAAQPFMRPAFDNQQSNAIARISQELWRALASRGIVRSISMPDIPISPPDDGDLL